MYNRCTLVEFRGVWIASVYNIDWPKTLDNPEAQKQEFIEILDKLQSLNINAIFVQVRPTSDALYKSYINPWSKYLTGEQGKYPGYDPLQFMIEETHKRDMEFHAWLNPYRITTQGTDLNELAPNNPARIKPEWVLEFNNALFYDPENPEVIEYVAITVYEIIKKYDVDGIHFDDYFYPESTEIKDYAMEENQVSDIIAWRKKCITQLIKETHSVVKSANKNIEFGISPLGNNEKCHAMGIDAQELCKMNVIDYICPQLYWSLKYKVMPFEKAAKTWQEMTKNTGVKLFGGLALYKIGTELDDKTWQDDKNILPKEIDILEKLGYNGAILYSFGQLDESKEEISNLLKKLS